MTEYFSALYVVKTSLISLNMRSLKEIRSGSVAILENTELCYAQNINWKEIMKSTSHNTLLQNNRQKQKCKAESKICDTQCSESGCWGPGKGKYFSMVFLNFDIFKEAVKLAFSKCSLQDHALYGTCITRNVYNL